MPRAVGLVLLAVGSLQVGAAFAVELFDELAPRTDRPLRPRGQPRSAYLFATGRRLKP